MRRFKITTTETIKRIKRETALVNCSLILLNVLLDKAEQRL